MSRAAPLRWALPGLVVVIAAVWFVIHVDGGDDTTIPIDLRASVPTHATLGSLVDASDLVVVAEVVSIGRGRVLTDPRRPDVGVQTELVELTVVQSLDPAPRTILLEQEVSLLDGTPITVNGVPPLHHGDLGMAFLIAGEDAGSPYTALTTPGSWIPVDDGILTDARPVSSVLTSWVGRTASELLDAADAAGS